MSSFAQSSKTRLEIVSDKVSFRENCIEADLEYQSTSVKRADCGKLKVYPKTTSLKIRTDTKVGRVGVMLVGWGGNNGSTLTAAIEANRRGMQWRTRDGLQVANWYGSITQASTVLIGTDDEGQDVYAPMKELVPMFDPFNLVVSGWDINYLNMADSMRRAKVLDLELQDELYDVLCMLNPLPGIYDPSFIAANQSDRASNLIGGSKLEQYEQVRKDIQAFKAKQELNKVIVLWTANTERFCAVKEGLNMTADELMASLKANAKEISPSTIYAMASIAEHCTYINGSPQNTFVPGLIELAEKNGVFIAGDDFKSGQTKIKSVLVDYLVAAGIKPVSIVSYNHLGNNDGKNLSAPKQFRSKEISKSNVVDDVVKSNELLYRHGEHPDHVVVIKYVPYVGDSKRAMDEYTSEIMMGGHNTLVLHNTCEDSLLAAPLMLDLVILAELCSRIKIKSNDAAHAEYEYFPFRPVLSILSYLCKAPLVPKGCQVVNSLFRQRSAIENILRSCIGLAPLSHMALEQRFDCPALQDKHELCRNGAEKQHANGKRV